MASATSLRYLTMEELNKTALDQFVYQPVGRDMIAYLAQAAHNVIACDSTLMPPAPAEPRQNLPTPPRSPEPRTVRSEDGALPTLEEFITQLVVSSNVQVPTLMSTLVYLGRLKSKLQPMARGLRCTAHRIFLAALILSAKYLNDSSPKNKHWANYSHITTEYYSFGFSRTEVNLMEKQLLFLLDWDLRINPEDLYYHLEPFLAPIRVWQARQAEKQRIAEKEREMARQQYKLTAENLQRSRMESAYDSPASFSAYAQRSRAYNTPSSRALSRTPSLSPPCRSSSSSSTSDSPISFTEETTEAVVQRYDADAGATLVHIQAPAHTRGKLEHSLPLYDNQPAKKAKTAAPGGGFFNRMFGSGVYGTRQSAY